MGAAGRPQLARGARGVGGYSFIHSGMQEHMAALLADQHTQVDEDNCRRGLVVVRGPAWDWGEQDGGDGGVGVILRQFYIDNPYKHTDKHLAEDEDEEDTHGHMFDAPDKLCLVQVRWASASVQTYRVGTYGNK